MSTEDSDQGRLSYEGLLQQNQALSQEIHELDQQRMFAWGLFAETSRKLQVYSASIKAAVSSLLNYDIFWDSANQHEFLETINTSVNQVSELIVLLTLAFRTEEGSLSLKRDPQMLQEILSVAQENARIKYPELTLNISYPLEGKMVLVDYEYLIKVLLLVLDVYCANISPGPVFIKASEGKTAWFVDFSGFDAQLMQTIEQMHRCKTQPANVDFLSAENILRLHIACEVLHLQEIRVEVLEQAERPPVLRLWVPVVENPKSILE